MASSGVELVSAGTSASTRSRSKRDRLRARLIGEIGTRALRPGDALPTERELAETMQFSRGTVRMALDDLEREGIILRVQGKGTFVADQAAVATQGRAAGFAVILLEVASPYHSSLLAGFEQAAHDAGQPALVCNSNNNVDKQASYLLRLLDQRVAGVVLNPSGTAVTPACHLRVLQEAGIPVVLLHRAVPDASAPVLELPGEEVGHDAGRIMAEAGHRRVGFISSTRSDVTAKYESGLRQAIAAAGGDLPTELVDYGLASGALDSSEFEAHLETVLPRMLAVADRPTAIFLTFDTLAEMAYVVAQRLGLRVPDDLSIVCFGGVDRRGAIMRRLTAITIDTEAAGRRAAELLVEMREGKRPIQQDQRIALELGVSAGETLGPPSAKKTVR